MTQPPEPHHPHRPKEPFDDPAYLFELKLDSFRGLVDTIQGRMLSKNGNRMRRSRRCSTPASPDFPALQVDHPHRPP